MKKIIICFILCLAFSHLALAEDDETPSVLGRTMDGILDSFNVFMTPSEKLDPIIVTASRYEEPSLNVSKNVTVITKETIENSHARYVPELLEDIAGVVVRDYIGNGKAVQVDIRGFGETAVSNVLVLVDGRRTNQIDITGTDWAQIPVDAIERIEIIEGPQSVLYGDNATGGVINIITKSGQGKKPTAGFKLQLGSYKYNEWEGFIEGGSNFLDYYGYAGYSDSHGYRVNNHLKTEDLNGNITLKPTDDLKIRIYGGYHKDWFGLPGALSGSEIGWAGRRGSIYPNDRAKTEDFYVMAGPDFRYDFGFGDILITGDILARGRRTNSLFYSTGWDTAITNHIKTFGVTPKLAFTTHLFGIDNRMLLGLDYYNHKDEILSGGPTTEIKDLIIIEKESLGLYATDTVHIFEPLYINGGFRAEWAHYRFDQQQVLRDINERKPFEYAYEAGIDYKYNKKSSLYANFQRSFRFPAVDEWYSALWEYWGLQGGGLNLGLKPQHGISYEVGIKEKSSKYINLEASYYYMDTRKEIYFNPITLVNSTYDHTTRWGINTEAHAHLFDIIHFFANYTYQKAYFVGGDFAGNDIPMVPRHKFSLGFNLSFMDSVFLRYASTYIGKRRLISDQRNTITPLKPYMTHNVKLTYRKYGFEIFGCVNNIFNAKYSECGVTNSAGTAETFYPSPERNFLLGASLKF